MRPTVPAATAPIALDVSIIIVNWNTRDLLRDCLQSIYRHAGAETFEIIVTDNHSADGSADMVAAEFPGVRLIRNDDNLGFAAANNQGIAIARGRYVLLLNSDTVVLEGTIARSLAFADAHPRAAVVGCRTIFADGVLQVELLPVPQPAEPRAVAEPPGRRLPAQPLLRAAAADLVGLRHAARGRCGGRLLHARPRRGDPPGRARWPKTTSCTPRTPTGAGGSAWPAGRCSTRPKPQLIHLRAASSSKCETDMRLQERRSLLLFFEKKSGRFVRLIANLMFLCSSLARVPMLWAGRLMGGAAAGRASSGR